MYLKEIWRYPVKSMAGESLQSSRVTRLGLEGDRITHVRNRQGRVITARTHPKLLGYKGSDVIDPADLEAIAGPGAHLVHDESGNRFDVLPLLVATDGAIEGFGRDSRRLRPNLIIGGVPGLSERAWPGRKLRIGNVLIHLDSLRARCVMTTYDPDTQQQDLAVLKDIVRRFDGELALNAAVDFEAAGLQGMLSVGAAVELLEPA